MAESSLEAEVLRLLRATSEHHSLSHFEPGEDTDSRVFWHLAPERGNLLRHLDFAGLRVLEVWPSFGGLSRLLAERAEFLTLVEPREDVRAIHSERLEGLRNWEHADWAQIVAGGPAYDVICLIEPPPGPGGGNVVDDRVIEACLGRLSDQGVLLMAVPNSLAMCFWSGATDPTTGLIFEGVTGHPAGREPVRTLRSVSEVLARHGLAVGKSYFANPDHLLVSSVIDARLLEVDASLAGAIVASETGRPFGGNLQLFPETLTTPMLAKNGVFPQFASTFLVLASRSERSDTLSQLVGPPERLAWHYSRLRRLPTHTLFQLDNETAEVLVEKTTLINGDTNERVRFADHGLAVTWHAQESTPVSHGTPLQELLLRDAYSGSWGHYQRRLHAFIGWSLQEWRLGGELLGGGAIDAITKNALVPVDGDGFLLFDLEWELQEPMPASWFIFRNVCALAGDADWYAGPAPYESLLGFYEGICRAHDVAPDARKDADREARFQHLVSHQEYKRTHERLLTMLEGPLGGAVPRRLHDWPARMLPSLPLLSLPTDRRLLELEREIDRLRATTARQQTVIERLASANDRLLKAYRELLSDQHHASRAIAVMEDRLRSRAHRAAEVASLTIRRLLLKRPGGVDPAA